MSDIARILSVLCLVLSAAVAGCSSSGVYVATRNTIVTREDFLAAQGYDVAAAQGVWGTPFSKNVSRDEYLPNLWTVSLQEFEAQEAEQEREDFCWAACAQMLLRCYGEESDQTAIVERIKGPVEDLQDGTASANQICKAIGGPMRASSVVVPGNMTAIALDLSTNWPVIVGLREHEDDEYGHAYIITSMELSWYGMPGSAMAVVDGVTLFDPMPGESREHMSGQEFKEKLAFTIHCREAGKAYLRYPRRRDE